MILGVPKLNIPEKVCDIFLIDKQPKNAFSANTTHRLTEVLNVVYSDACSPLEVPLMGAGRFGYF